jgi:hypothetical protein
LLFAVSEGHEAERRRQCLRVAASFRIRDHSSTQGQTITAPKFSPSDLLIFL